MSSYVEFKSPVELPNILQNGGRNFLSRKYSRPFEEVIEEINRISNSAIGKNEKLEGIKHKIHRCLLYRQKLPLNEFVDLTDAYVVAYDKDNDYEPFSGEASEEACLGDFYENIGDCRDLLQLFFKEPFQEEGADFTRKMTACGCLAKWKDWAKYLKELEKVTTADLMDTIETHLEYFPFENPGQQLEVIQGLLSKLKDDDTKKYDLKYRLLYILKGLVLEARPSNSDDFEAKGSPSKTLENLVKKASPGSAKDVTEGDRGKKHLNGYSKAPMSSARELFRAGDECQEGPQEVQPAAAAAGDDDAANDQRTRSYTTLKTCLIALLIIGGATALYVNRATLASYVRRVKKWFGIKIGSF